jgi:hypothetical protein
MIIEGFRPEFIITTLNFLKWQDILVLVLE